MPKNNHTTSVIEHTICCELVYIPSNAAPQIFSRPWQEGMTITRLVETSGLLQQYPEVAQLSVGIFARCVSWDTLVKPGDRVELYRPLLLDPKENRRHKARAKAK